MPYSEDLIFSTVNLNSNHFESSSNWKCRSSGNVVWGVFSQSRPQKHWFALNTDLCGIVARKFCENEIFKVFTDEVKCVKINECRDQNGVPIPKAKGNKTDRLYVGSKFAVIAGNLRRKDPSASELLKRKDFQKIIDVLNRQSLTVSHDNNDGGALNDTCTKITTPDSLSLDSSDLSSSRFISSDSLSSYCGNDVEKGNLKRKRLAPKKSAPFLTSTPQASVTEYETPYKKRKWRKIAVSLMSDIEDICDSNNETLSSVIARCCLFERNDDVECDKLLQSWRKLKRSLDKMKRFKNLFQMIFGKRGWEKWEFQIGNFYY